MTPPLQPFFKAFLAPLARRRAAALVGLGLVLLTGCPPAVAVATPAPLQLAFDKGNALEIADTLETLIGDGKDTEQDRQTAYDMVRQKELPTAEYAYARAMVTGRLAQKKGLTAAFLLREMEEWTKKSIALDAAFRDGAATRMLGTLYVLAPASLLSGGDSEKGLEILEALVKKHPNAVENHLRYAEAQIALGDPGPAAESLCHCLAHKASLRKDDQSLLQKLFQDAGSPTCPAP